MRIHIIVRRNPTTSPKNVTQTSASKKDVRQIEFVVDYEDGSIMDKIVFRRFEDTKHKANESTIEKIASQLRHFFDYFFKIKPAKEGLTELELERIMDQQDLLATLMYDMDAALNVEIVKDEVMRRLDKDKSAVYRDKELEIYKETIDKLLFRNNELINLVMEYVGYVTYGDLDVSSDGNKLTEADIFIIHCLIIYSKLIYIPYFRITVEVAFIEVARKVLIDIGNVINEKLKEQDMFPREDVQDSFISRFYAFLLNAASYEFDRHKKNLEKFALVGMSKEAHAMRSIMDQLLYSFLRIVLCVKEIKTPEDAKRLYENDSLESFHEFGLIPKSCAAYIQSTKSTVADHTMGKYKPRYVLKTLSTNDEGGTEMSQTSRFELQQSKNNKEQYDRMVELASDIIDDITSKIGIPMSTIDKIYDSIKSKRADTFRTPLNKMVVSRVLDGIYNNDVSDIIDLRGFLIICLYAHESLIKYPDLANAILAQERGRINNVCITEDMITSKICLQHAKERFLNIITKICSVDYVVVSNSGIMSQPYIVENDLIRWINDGCPI